MSNADQRHRDGDLQGFEKDTQQQECAQARTNDGENDRRQQAAAAENAPTDERQRAAAAHKMSKPAYSLQRRRGLRCPRQS